MDIAKDVRSIDAVAARVLAALDPGQRAAQSTRIQIVGLGVFGPPAARRRVVRTLLNRPTRSVAGGFGPEQLELLTQTLLVILNAVGTDLLTDLAKEQVTGWWQRRRLARVLSARSAPKGGDTLVGELPPAVAHDVAELTYRIAVRTGVGEQRARHVANLLAAELSKQP